MTDQRGAGRRPVVVDTDTGIDDALALIYLLGHPLAEVVEITAVYGNTHVESAVSNIARVLRLVGRDDIPVSQGAAHPLVRPPTIGDHVHGADGLGDLWHDRPGPNALTGRPAAERIVELAAEQPGRLDLLALGPLTNLAEALRLDAQVLTNFRSVVIMGGSGPFPPLSVAQGVDANIHNDPEAAAEVFGAAHGRLVSVGINATAGAIVDEAAVARLHAAGTPTAGFAAAILERYMDFYQYHWGRRVSPAHDSLAAALLIHPEWILRQETGPFNVLDDGFAARARLMRTADGREPSMPVTPAPDAIAVLKADQAAFLAEWERRIVRA